MTFIFHPKTYSKTNTIYGTIMLIPPIIIFYFISTGAWDSNNILNLAMVLFVACGVVMLLAGIIASKTASLEIGEDTISIKKTPIHSKVTLNIKDIKSIKEEKLKLYFQTVDDKEYMLPLFVFAKSDVREILDILEKKLDGEFKTY